MSDPKSWIWVLCGDVLGHAVEICTLAAVLVVLGLVHCIGYASPAGSSWWMHYEKRVCVKMVGARCVGVAISGQGTLHLDR